jgi:hypothetical protein
LGKNDNNARDKKMSEDFNDLEDMITLEYSAKYVERSALEENKPRRT